MEQAQAAGGYRLSELQRDALGEAFNIALGAAAEAFADIVREEVQLSVPSVELLSRSRLHQRLNDIATAGKTGRVCTIGQRFRAQSHFWTEVLVVFPESDSVEVVRRIMGTTEEVADPTELEEDTLAEIGNVIINACMGSLARLLKTSMIGGLPEARIRVGDTLLRGREDVSAMLSASVGMRLGERNVSGLVLLLMDQSSVQFLVREVERAFDL
jgi:chemotaxis protein CheC